jgi:ribose 5-phosphate isomerase B
MLKLAQLMIWDKVEQKANSLEAESMRVFVGADHAGYSLKEELVKWLQENNHDVESLGAHVEDPSDDYPDRALEIAEWVTSQPGSRGIVICGSGVGASVVANKVGGIRAGTCHDTYSAHQGVEHDDMNILCLGARIIGFELAKEVVHSFLNAQFSGDERHQRRLDKIIAIEERFVLVKKQDQI